MSRQRGVALLLVLWVLALLATLLAGLLGWVHLQNRQALWQRQQTQGLLAAQAGVGMAVMAQLDRDPQQHWNADNQPHELRFDEAQLVVGIRSEKGRLDLNAASADAFARLLSACGAPAQVSQQATQSLEQRRGGGRVPLRMIEELRELPGMTQPLYLCAAQEVTLWSGQSLPDARMASAWLRRALSLPHVAGTSKDAGPVITVTSRATLPGGYATTLIVTLLLNPSQEGTRPYRVLRWQE